MSEVMNVGVMNVGQSSGTLWLLATEGDKRMNLSRLNHGTALSKGHGSR